MVFLLIFNIRIRKMISQEEESLIEFIFVFGEIEMKNENSIMTPPEKIKVRISGNHLFNVLVVMRILDRIDVMRIIVVRFDALVLLKMKIGIRIGFIEAE